MKICNNCKNECNRLRKTFCSTCYTRFRLTGSVKKPSSTSAIPAILTQQQSNLMIGSLLGDGHLRKRKETWNATMRIERCQKDLDYLKWAAEICNDIITPAGISLSERFDQRTKKIYYSCNFETRALIALNEFHTKWYQNRIKVIPNDLKLNSEIIAIWVCDDGMLNTNKSSSNRFQLSLATNSFSKDEVHFLCQLLNERYNENFLVRQADKIKNQYLIKGADAATRTLISDIDLVFPQGMQRKRIWDKPETCFYENAPAKRMSSALSSDNKRNKIIEYLKLHNEFTLNELGTYAGFAFTRGNGKIEIATSNLSSIYLKQYMDDGLIIMDETKNRANKFRLTDSGKIYFQ